jgi:iron only hydrogenase large subunit-like protein
VLFRSGYPNVDAVLTTRELAYLIKDAGIDLLKLAEEDFDSELPAIPGMENVYCAPGDIATAVFHVSLGMLSQNPKDSPDVKFTETGTEGVRTTSVRLGSFDVKAAAITGLQSAIPFLDSMKAGKNELAFFEMLACPMGCISGGGQAKVLLPQDKAGVYAERASLHSTLDVKALSAIAKHPAVQKIYQDHFAKPCGDKSNRALHTQYVERKLSQ